ncbi:MAG: YbhB/YbcL family Raf kinase inhibitor-like protein [Anaerolineae bacterium]
MTLEISSAAFTAGGEIPREHTCDGADLSPPLSWTQSPQGTDSLAVICDDPDAPMGTWVHWVLFNLPGDLMSLPQGVDTSPSLAEGWRQGRNDFGRTGYGGPCPPPGPAHRYYFKLYALDGSLELDAGATKAQLLEAMEGHVLAQAEVMGRYAR